MTSHHVVYLVPGICSIVTAASAQLQQRQQPHQPQQLPKHTAIAAAIIIISIPRYGNISMNLFKVFALPSKTYSRFALARLILVA